MQEFIVGEVSKNWEGSEPAPLVPAKSLCGLFEGMIEHNRRRGYLLHSWKLDRIMTGPGILNETIIAVFKRRPEGVADAQTPAS